MGNIDYWAYNSRWRDTSPGYKTALALCTMVICLCSPFPPCHLLAILFMSLLTVWGGKIPLGRYLRILLPLAVLLAFSVLGILLQMHWGEPSRPGLALGQLTIYTTRASVLQSCRILLRALSCVACLFFLVLSTPIRDICALLAKLGAPGILVEQLALVYRFIFLLKDTAVTKGKSARSRQGLRRPRGMLQTLGLLWGTVFLQSMERGKGIYASMRARGYRQPGAMPSLRQFQPVPAKLVILAVALPGALLATHLF